MVKFQLDNPPEEKKAGKCDCSACNICKFFCREPQFILKVFLIVVNIVVVMTIIAANSVKLHSKVHATHTSLKVNHSLYYPAVSICQYPISNINLRYTNLTKGSVNEMGHHKSGKNMLRKVIEDAQLNRRPFELGKVISFFS